MKIILLSWVYCVTLCSVFHISQSATIYTKSPDGKDEYVEYKVSQPILEFDSSFNQSPPPGHASSASVSESQVSFDGDVYFSNARPFWEIEDDRSNLAQPQPQPQLQPAAAQQYHQKAKQVQVRQPAYDDSSNIVYGKNKFLLQ